MVHKYDENVTHKEEGALPELGHYHQLQVLPSETAAHTASEESRSENVFLKEWHIHSDIKRTHNTNNMPG